MSQLPPRARVVVTGAGSGLGRAFCEVLAKRGARIVVSDLDAKTASETAELVRSAGGEAIVKVADVSSFDDVEALGLEAERAFGGVDLLINNAGVAVGGDIGQTPLADWRWIIDINLMGVVHGCHAFVPRFRKQGRGAIINVASAAGLVHMPGMGAYNATKAAVVALSETLHAEVADAGIDVTVLCPTFFSTNIARNARSTDPSQSGFIEKLMQRSRVQARDVATHALESLETGQLHALPMADGLWFWRLKRMSPKLYPHLVRRLSSMAKKHSHRA